MSESKGMWIDELGSDSTKQPLRLYIGPASGKGESKSRAQTTKASDIVAVDQDVPLEAGEKAGVGHEMRRRTSLTFPWVTSRLCMYFNAREISVSWGKGVQLRNRR